jgi:hypothetical protein
VSFVSLRLRVERLIDAAAELAVGGIVVFVVDVLLPTWLAIVAGVAAIVMESRRHDRSRAAGQRRFLRPELALVATVVIGAMAMLLAVTPTSVVAVR